MIIALLYLAPVTTWGQERCGTSAYQTQQQPIFQGANLSPEAHAGHSTGTAVEQLNSPVPVPSKIVIPVVVHVLWRTEVENISDDLIRSQIESLNADFNLNNPDFSRVPSVFASLAGRAGVEFRLATTDPQGRATSGIIRGKTGRMMWTDDDKIKQAVHSGSNAWDSKQYLNIWIGNLVPGLLAYASFPGGAADKDGIVIRYDIFGTRGRLTAPYNKGRTLTHEVGHWLGLRHLWGDMACGDDGVHDTPRQRGGNKGIPVFPKINGGCDNGPQGDMFMNFMDFSDDETLLMFTQGQVDIMRAQFQSGGARSAMLLSKGLAEPWNMTLGNALVEPENPTVNIYPNPAASYVRIRTNQSPENTDRTFVLFTAGGQILQKGRLNGNDQFIDLNGIPRGLYYIRVGSEVVRFIKGS